MSRIFKRYILPFIIAVCLCSVICFCIMAPLIFTKTELLTVDEPYLSAPYAGDISTVLITFSDLPVAFTAQLDTFSGSCSVFCFPLKCGEGALEPDSLPSKADVNALFSVSADKYISARSDYLKNLIDGVGGITLVPKYSLPSPTGGCYLPKGGDPLQIYGSSVVGLIAAEAHPDRERMEHYSEMVCKALLKRLSSLSEDSFYAMTDSAETDISYADFYDFSKTVAIPFEWEYYSAPYGEWRDGYYYLD